MVFHLTGGVGMATLVPPHVNVKEILACTIAWGLEGALWFRGLVVKTESVGYRLGAWKLWG